MIRIGVLKETIDSEKRVAISPNHIKELKSLGLDFSIEKDAGKSSYFYDKKYAEESADIEDKSQIIADSKIILKINPFQSEDEYKDIKPGTIVVSTVDPFFNLELIKKLNDKKITLFALDMIPRITRAQSMDILSSMSSIAGYKAVLEAANRLPKYFPMLMTAAGTITPAKVLILGAGVAGLQAIATGKRLGANVSAYDIRPVVKEQVESLGAKFIELGETKTDAETAGGYAKEQTKEELEKQQRELEKIIIDHDVVITTALIPGRKAPILIKGDVVKKMKAGSVVVDIATEKGGNVEGSKLNEIIETENGVQIIGYSDYPSKTSNHASTLFSRNIIAFLKEFIVNGEIKFDMENEVIKSTMICHEGKILDERFR